MDDTIRHLRCAYRSFGSDQTEATAAAARFDGIVRTELADRYNTALDAVMGAQAGVYVMRNVHASTAIAAYASLSDAALADIVGRRMAVAVVSTIHRDIGDGTNLVRFASDAEFIAQFVAALADGTAWSRWFFFPFLRLQHHPTPAAIRTVLLEHRQCLPQVLAVLQRCGSLERVCRAAGAEELNAVWRLGIRRDEESSPDAFRPLFATATALADRLDLWAGTRPSAQHLQGLFELYLAAAPEPVSWTDRRGLAVVLLEIVRFLTGRGVLRSIEDAEQTARDYRAALAEFDWLDVEYVVAGRLAQARPTPAPWNALPALRVLTSRQQRIATDLLQLLLRDGAALDGAHPSGAANHIRLYASLVERAAQDADDAFARCAVESVLQAWTWLTRGDRAVVIDLLRAGRIEQAIALTPVIDASEARAIQLTVAMFGQRAAVEALSVLPQKGTGRAESSDAGTASGGSIATRCAGVFLLSRAVLDIHLQAIVSAADAGGTGTLTLDMVLAALALRWGGDDSAAGSGAALDEGVRLFAGLPGPDSLPALCDRWAAVDVQTLRLLQEAAFTMLAGLRAVAGSVLHIHEVRLDSALTAVVAGLESGDIWPLAAIVDPDSVAPVVSRWIDVWAATLGQPPQLVVSERWIHAALAERGIEARFVAEGAAGASGDPAGEALSRGLDAIAAARVGLPDVDLTIATLAISVLRVWARWLGHFADSTAPYLLDRFVRRPGYLDVTDDSLVVTLEPRPLDLVVEKAGYMDVLAAVPWLGDRRLRFARAAAP